jgi:hypothetical protein
MQERSEKMLKKLFLFVLGFVITAPIFSSGGIQFWIALSNNSDTELLLTVRLKEGVGPYWTDVNCYDDGTFVGKVTIIQSFPFEKHILKIYPEDQGWSIITYHFFDPIAPIIIFRNVIEDVVVYDLEGNVIMTKEDIENELVDADRKHDIHITNETVNAGRIKYRGLTLE